MVHRIVVSPAGRERYLRILFRHLKAQKHAFDEWHLWVNTRNAADVAFMEGLAATTTWIKLVHCPHSNPDEGNLNIHRFFKACAQPGVTYLRLDDDVVWLEKGFVDKMFTFREAHPEYFLVYATIVNNAITSHIFQRNGLISTKHGIAGYQCMDPVGWGSPAFAHEVHSAFVQAVRDNSVNDWRFRLWHLQYFERCSINAISWLGDEFARFGGEVGHDEEQWLSVDKPQSLRKMNAIYGNALCVHFSFYTQRDVLDSSGMLAEYQRLADDALNE